MARDNAALHLLTGGDPAAAVRVPILATTFTVLAANKLRTNATIYYEETGTPGAYVSLKFGSGAAAADYTIRLFPGTYLSLRERGLAGYTGIITALGDVGTGQLQVQEFT